MANEKELAIACLGFGFDEISQETKKHERDTLISNIVTNYKTMIITKPNLIAIFPCDTETQANNLKRDQRIEIDYKERYGEGMTLDKSHLGQIVRKITLTYLPRGVIDCSYFDSDYIVSDITVHESDRSLVNRVIIHDFTEHGSTTVTESRIEGEYLKGWILVKDMK